MALIPKMLPSNTNSYFYPFLPDTPPPVIYAKAQILLFDSSYRAFDYTPRLF